ncbi:hypothetical protein [Persicirhabdus sediminis]|uniref:Uncharacterized protein n=1 Tax=Persicirhabdus sediminis TaxID=454144 RepID=A0A8J7SKU7_9BACT|nr:hypothetical protein [Persicirhabdus sediminis]MBK1791005.1 hypothetical protein [Persicirhabdus sediminis]
MTAHIKNKYADKELGLPPYYEFVVSTASNETIRSRRIRVERMPLNFRMGSAEDWIKWSPDSRSVVFVSPDAELWREESLPGTQEAEQAASTNR